MALIPYKQIHTPQTELNRVQTNIKLFTEKLINIPLLDGVLLKDISLSTSETKVDHKLGRKYRGWVVVDKNANQDLWISSTTSSERFLTFTASGTVTVTLWVF